MKPSEFAEACAAKIDEGWCQGRLQDTNGNVCALGAIRYVEENNPHTPYSMGEVCSQLIKRTSNYFTISSWNDDATTKEEVIDAFMQIAKDLRNEGR